jgi:hypothetical protein
VLTPCAGGVRRYSEVSSLIDRLVRPPASDPPTTCYPQWAVAVCRLWAPCSRGSAGAWVVSTLLLQLALRNRNIGLALSALWPALFPWAPESLAGLPWAHCNSLLQALAPRLPPVVLVVDGLDHLSPPARIEVLASLHLVSASEHPVKVVASSSAAVDAWCLLSPHAWPRVVVHPPPVTSASWRPAPPPVSCRRPRAPWRTCRPRRWRSVYARGRPAAARRPILSSVRFPVLSSVRFPEGVPRKS